LIPESEIFGIRTEIETDSHRPEAGEQALRDTAASVGLESGSHPAKP
jgi:hypothetical protein